MRRVYEPIEPDDGYRVLVDRLWPRGLSKQAAHFEEWCKQIAPSTELRKWYGHQPDRFAEFARRYRSELDDAEHADALTALRDRAQRERVTLLTATKQTDISAASVLAEVLAGA